ncbi:MAG TPA: glycerate-2-kinase family protein, partial [Gammaproteobacteria bacterium]|nr:glycerate-2-kinase family protein [Gammaproteobacteria bacterium]
MSGREGLKADAEAAFREGLAAADPGRAVSAWLHAHPGIAASPDRTLVVAVGKGACAMAAGALEARGLPPAHVLVVTKDGHGTLCPEGVELREAGHPRPDVRSLAAGEVILERAASLGAGDELLLLVSGGASALAEALPAAIEPEDWFAANDALVGSGLPIQAINAVRKHCSLLKGGQLARAAAPARVTALLLSDVIGDDPAVIGSGPAAPDPTTYADALDAVKGVTGFPPAIRAHLEAGQNGAHPETPKPGELEG